MSTDKKQHDRQGFRKRIERRQRILDTPDDDTQLVTTQMTADEHREEMRQELLAKQEREIRENAKSELIDHMILHFTGRDFLSTSDFIRSYRTEAIAFLVRYDIIKPSIHKKLIKETLDEYLEYRYEIIEKTVHKVAKGKQGWIDWLLGREPKNLEIIATSNRTTIDRQIKLGKYKEALDNIRMIKQANDHHDFNMDYEFMYKNDELLTFNEENALVLPEKPYGTNFTNK